jgi:DnaJ-class molecular chaperone
MKADTKITLVGQGNQQVKREPTDLHITFKHKESEDGLYRRRENTCDLYYKHKISLVDALQCKPICLTTLDGRNLRIAVDSLMAPGTVKVVQDEGLPYLCDDPKEIKK